MKNLFLIFLLLCGSAGAAQKRLLALPFRAPSQQMTVAALLESVARETGLVIEYASTTLDGSRLVQLAGNENSVGAVLRTVLAGQYVRLAEKNGKIMLVPSSQPLKSDALLPQYQLFGFIKAQDSNEPLVDANIQSGHSGKGTVSNPYGYFSLTLPEGSHQVLISFTGFAPLLLQLDLKQHEHRDILLQPLPVVQDTLVVQSGGHRKDASDKISPENQAPYSWFLGSHDPIRATYMLPGVKNVPESFNGMLVRGGGADENLFLLDGNPVYNPTHMLGALSVVSPTALKSMRLYKSDFPARFSGALSSVMDVYTKDGNMQRWTGEASLGFLAGAVTVEGPLVKDKASLMASFRHSWPYGFLRFFHKGLRPEFRDVHVKGTRLLDKRNKLTANFYWGEDELRQDNKRIDNLHQWGNLLGSLAWNRVLGRRSFVNTSVNMSRYYNLGGFQYTLYDGEQDDSVLQVRSLGTYSSIEQYSARTGAEIYLSPRLKLNAGARLSYSIIRPFETKISETLQDNQKDFGSFPALPFGELSAYGEWEYRPGKWFFRPGLHLSGYRYRDFRFLSPQPRFFVSRQAGRALSLYASFTHMTQFLHLVTNPYLGANSNLWVPSTRLLQPEQSRSYNLGLQWRGSYALRLSVEGYLKKMEQVTNVAEGKSYFINSKNWQQNIESGRGRCYGLESRLEHKGRKLSLQAAYTLAWSWRRFASINGGMEFPYKYDRRHDGNLGVTCHLPKGLALSLLWSFATGDRITLPDQIYPDFDYAQGIQNPEDLLKDYRFIYHFSGVNQFRTAPYQRLDLSVRWEPQKKSRFRSQFSAGVYNVSGAPDQYTYDLRGSLRTRRILVETRGGSFLVTPYISYLLKF